MKEEKPEDLAPPYISFKKYDEAQIFHIDDIINEHMICVNILKAGPKGILKVYLVWKIQLIALTLVFRKNYRKGES